MTREEELDWLYRLKSKIYVYMPKEWIIPMSDALNTAIKALEQQSMPTMVYPQVEGITPVVVEPIPKLPSVNLQPCEDAISRQAVMDCFKKWQPYMATRLWEFEQELSALPSINPQPCEDAISRQALLDAFGLSEKTRKWGGDHSGYNTMMLYEIQDMIESAPPVTPQPKTGHWKSTIDGKPICSECGFVSESEDGYFVSRYCPNCGRRMFELQEVRDNMADIELVIKMPENTYRRIQALARDGYFEHDICGNSMRRIANGTPLPKGHGRLIDESNLMPDSDYEDGIFYAVSIGQINSVPAIIEADKAESEDKE